MEMTPTLSVPLYWSLPGPARFVHKIATTARSAKATAFSLPRHEIPGLWDRIREGLVHAHIVDPKMIKVSANTNLPGEIGQQFGVESMTGSVLAHHKYGAATAVILRSEDSDGAKACEAYFRAFIDELNQSHGDVRLIIETRDGEVTEDGSNGALQVIAFDGGLPPVEMQAYITLRMIERQGPGSTTLLSSLVVEYAGFDPFMAEQLMAMPQEDILALPESMTALLEREPARWTADSWREGTIHIRKGQVVLHPLREWYLAKHGGHRAAEMQSRASRRYWRACVKSMTPWLEERRNIIMQLLKEPLDKYQRVHGGFYRRNNSGYSPISRSELEYNNIVGMVNDPDRHLELPDDVLSAQILTTCRHAKSVRDAIAHMRPPKNSDVADLIRTMDLVLASAPSVL